MVSATMAFVFLNCGQGQFYREDNIAILVLSGQDEDSVIGPEYGLDTKKGIPSVLLRLIFPMCLFAGAALVGAT
jgi:hypothetical protein